MRLAVATRQRYFPHALFMTQAQQVQAFTHARAGIREVRLFTAIGWEAFRAISYCKKRLVGYSIYPIEETTSC